MEQNFDDYLKQELEASTFKATDADWQQALAMLEDEDKKDKPVFFYWRNILLILASLAIGFFAIKNIFSKQNATPLTKNTATQNATIASTLPTNKVVNNATKTIGVEKPQSTPTPNATSQLPSNTKTDNELNKNSNAITNVNIDAQNSKPIINAKRDLKNSCNKNSSIKQKINNAAMPSRVTNTIDSNVQIVNTDNIIKTSKAPKVVAHIKSILPSINTKSYKNKKTTQTSKANSNLIAESKKTITNKKVKKSKDKIVNSIKNIAQASKNIAPVDSEVYKIEQANLAQIKAFNEAKYKTKNNEVAKTPRDDSKYNPRYKPNAKFVKQTATAIVVKLDTAAPKANTVLKAKNKSQFDKKIKLNIKTGLMVNKGFANKDSAIVTKAFNVAPYVSFGIAKNITQKLSLEAQIGITYFNAINLQKQSPVYQYTFTRQAIDNFTVNYKRMNELFVPINIHYLFAKNNYLTAGLGLGYIIDVQSLVQENNKANPTLQYGYKTGFNKLDMMAHFGYGYKINNRINLEINVFKGFMDVTKDAYFKNIQFDTQTRIALGLKFNLN
jgi:hypothetical protein